MYTDERLMATIPVPHHPHFVTAYLTFCGPKVNYAVKKGEQMSWEQEQGEFPGPYDYVTEIQPHPDKVIAIQKVNVGAVCWFLAKLLMSYIDIYHNIF